MLTTANDAAAQIKHTTVATNLTVRWKYWQHDKNKEKQVNEKKKLFYVKSSIHYFLSVQQSTAARLPANQTDKSQPI